MKIVKDSINEIKKYSSQRGLSTIGVGTIKFIDSYVEKEFDKLQRDEFNAEYYVGDGPGPMVLVILIDSKKYGSLKQKDISLVYHGSNKKIEFSLSNTYHDELKKYNCELSNTPTKLISYTVNAVELYTSNKFEDFFNTLDYIIKKEIKGFKTNEEPLTEIKRDGIGPAFGSIGIGNTAVTHAFDLFFKKYPSILRNINSEDTMIGRAAALKYALQWVADILHTKINRIGYINARLNLHQRAQTFLDRMIDDSISHNYEKSFELENRTLHSKLVLSEQNQLARMTMDVEYKDTSKNNRKITFYLFKMPYDLKESLNEIKREATSGLSSIGIGDVVFNKAYKHLINYYPLVYEDHFDTLDMAKHYANSHVTKYKYILKEVKKLLNATEDKILYSVTLKKKLPEIPRWIFQSVSKSSDLEIYKKILSSTTYVVLRYSESLGVVVASIYGPEKGVSIPIIKKTFCFVRF